MGYGDEKVIVQVVDGKDGELEHIGPDGKKRTFYPARQNWLDLQELEVWQYLKEPEEDGGQPTLVMQVRGEARLEDYDISVIGEPDNKTRSLRVTMEARDVEPALKDVHDVLGISFSKPLGAAYLGFSRADWEIGNSDEWWLSCYVTDATLRAMCDAVTAGTLRSVKLGVRLRDLYTTDHPFAPASSKAHLYLRPNRSDNAINWPQNARGYIMQLAMGMSRVDMRPVQFAEDDPDQEHMEVRNLPPDPVATAVASLTATVAALRTTVKWVGGITAACLVILAFR